MFLKLLLALLRSYISRYICYAFSVVWVGVWCAYKFVIIPIIAINTEKVKFIGHYIYNIYMIYIFLSRLKCLNDYIYIYSKRFFIRG
jgi:hypothetical protein